MEIQDGTTVWELCKIANEYDIPDLKKYPLWYYQRGDGSDGDYHPKSNQTISANKKFNNVTIDAGITITISNGAILQCANAFVCNGTITANGLGGSGGSGTWNGAGKTPSNIPYYIARGGAGGRAGAHAVFYNGGSGGTGDIYSTADNNETVYGCGGGGGAVGNGNGGSGGGCIKIVAKTFENNGIITANGNNGNNGTSGEDGNAGGGGGGGGGLIIIAADTVKAQGTITCKGGSGGSAIGSGSPGASGENGKVIIAQLKG